MKNRILADRIRKVRKGYRAGQPLDFRVKLVRERHAAARKASRKTVQVRWDGHK